MSGIYIASKAKWGPRWQQLRRAGVPIISTWIDESGVGETTDFPDLWDRCIREASSCSALIYFQMTGEEMKGALVEVGAALAAGKPVFIAEAFVGSWLHHPLVHVCDGLEGAIKLATRACQ